MRLDPVLCTNSPVDGQQVDVNTGDDCPDLKDHCSCDDDLNDYADNGDPTQVVLVHTTQQLEFPTKTAILCQTLMLMFPGRHI